MAPERRPPRLAFDSFAEPRKPRSAAKRSSMDYSYRILSRIFLTSRRESQLHTAERTFILNADVFVPVHSILSRWYSHLVSVIYSTLYVWYSLPFHRTPHMSCLHPKYNGRRSAALAPSMLLTILSCTNYPTNSMCFLWPVRVRPCSRISTVGFRYIRRR